MVDDFRLDGWLEVLLFYLVMYVDRISHMAEGLFGVLLGDKLAAVVRRARPFWKAFRRGSIRSKTACCMPEVGHC